MIKKETHIQFLLDNFQLHIYYYLLLLYLLLFIRNLKAQQVYNAKLFKGFFHRYK